MGKTGKTALFTDDLFLEHNTGPDHPENYQRLIHIRERLEKQKYYGKLKMLDRRFATPDQIGLIHDAKYVKLVKEFCDKQGGFLDGDTICSKRSYEAASLAAGAGLEAADKIIAGDISRALLLLRPPGHHSLQSRAMGFCLFNNIAICARHLQSLGLSNIAILDWDVHHGNGTEAVFYDDPSVLFISIHQYPHYPGTGAAEDTGEGAGTGYTLNIPMAEGSGVLEYQAAFRNSVLPKLKEFKPDALLVSAGFDAHKDDPLAGIMLTTASFEWMTVQVREFADEYCQGRLVSFLEGGYNLGALSDSVETHAAALL